MIKLDVAPYCHKGCTEFEVELDKDDLYYSHRTNDIVIQCKHRFSCECMMRYLNASYEEHDDIRAFDDFMIRISDLFHRIKSKFFIERRKY